MTRRAARALTPAKKLLENSNHKLTQPLCAFGFYFVAPLREPFFSQRRKGKTKGAKG
jgi:hypothetical protein